MLKRDRETTPQARLGRKMRASNVKGAFSVTHVPAGIQKVLLIDDVLTTGATLDAAACALKQAGVEEVCAYTFARAL